MLSREQLTAYERDGVVLVENVVDEAMLGRLRRALSDLVAASASVTAHDDVYDIEPDHSAANPRLRRIKHPHRRHPVFRELCTTEPLLSILKQLLGPNIRMHSSKLNVKAPSGGAALEWHQDWAFHPHTNASILAIGVMLEDCRADNGPMLVLPGSHRTGVHDHNAERRFVGAIDPERVKLDYGRRIACTGRAGTISIHHTFAVHGSAPNTSPYARPFLLYELMAADAWPLAGVPDVEEYDSRMICGETTYCPRLEAVPVRLPLPAAKNLGSIYENQTTLKRRYFG